MHTRYTCSSLTKNLLTAYSRYHTIVKYGKCAVWSGKTVEKRPFISNLKKNTQCYRDENGIQTIGKDISFDEGLDYPLKCGQNNGNGSIILRRVVQAPVVAKEIPKGLLQQYLWILYNLFIFI